MPRLLFSKASLHKESAQLKRFRQYLPSLDLKRQQLIVERNKAIAQLSKTENLISDCQSIVHEQLPMLADEQINLEGLVSIKEVTISEENRVGIKVPYLQGVDIELNPYSFLTKPHWVDLVVLQLKEMMELKISLKVNQQRLEILQQAVKKVTQKVNLFDKVLIPKTQKNISNIKIYLSDMERASVIRAKITKQKRLKDNL
jgi:V/A-type H+-transporting ATPase subunit D